MKILEPEKLLHHRLQQAKNILVDVGYPHEGAKEHYILDIDNVVFLKEIVFLAEAATPVPKPGKKRIKI